MLVGTAKELAFTALPLLQPLSATTAHIKAMTQPT
jgi:hypothetical protein